ncbi:hypothetical protein [Maricaulis sp.]|uniref:hypothetical protein n=1 Tax=Maricaulis sp. TaxID=1486257 RepID=UPI003A8F3CB7
MSRQAPDQIAVRAYTEVPGKQPVGAKVQGRGLDEPSAYTLVFDCETDIDAAQSLRVGFYQVRKHKALHAEGAFYDPDGLTPGELVTLQAYCEERGLTCLTVWQFREDVLLEYGYDKGGAIVGFNLPFDISRIAIRHGEARGSMRGGFSFEVSENRERPNIRVKHLSARAALTDFAAPAKQITPRGMRKRGTKVKPSRGYFIDLKTLAAALTSRSFSLGSLAEFLKVQTQKLETEEHGGALSDGYLDYARADVGATWDCYAALMAMYAQHALETPAHRILSEASLGKAYLKQMGVKPLLACQDVPREIFGIIMSGYFGGRAEVRIRRVVTEVLYCDFKSMYPTVNALMGLARFMIADGMSWHDATQDARDRLEHATLEGFLEPDAWRDLAILVRIRPDGDVMPVRAQYDSKVNTIGLNHLTYEGGLWFTLADCILSKLLTGKTPEVLEALRFEPGPPQAGLKPIRLFGRDDFTVDPLTEDVFTRFIDMRDEAKANGDPAEKAIKIIANSTSYGIFIEVNRDNAPKPEPIAIYGPSGVCQLTKSKAIEEPGRYFHPLLGVLITGAARLMLGLSECLTLKAGLQWTFCDTDSLAIARPDGMARDDFRTRSQWVVDQFVSLNPYKKVGSILQIEDVNYATGNATQLEPLYAFAISAKRYALFNIDGLGKPVIRKASAHGLGHLMAPYGDNDPAIGSPKPLPGIGVNRWQYDYWFKLIEAGLSDKPHELPLEYHSKLKTPASSRYGATSPQMLAWMKAYNEGRACRDQVKPFGFMACFTARDSLYGDFPEPVLVDPSKRGRPNSERLPKPSAPFDRDPEVAVARAFDRISGEPVARCALKTYAEALAGYHLHPEDKFVSASYWDFGETQRRHVVAEAIELIGKEANGVGQFGERTCIDQTAYRNCHTL